MFNQRLGKNLSEQYYFQIQPNFITIKNPNTSRGSQNKGKTLKLKLLKENELADETRKQIPFKPINGKIPVQKAQLNFYIPSYNQNNPVQYNLCLFEHQETPNKECQIGNCIISTGGYVSQFKQKKTRRFTQEINLSEQYTVNMDVYINTTRYALEKFIRQSKQQMKEQIRNNIKDTNIQNPPRISQARSQANSQSSKGEIISGQNRFMSPSRRIVRKTQQQKKLLMRSGSPARSQRSGGGSQSSKISRDLKFLSGKQGGTSPKRQRQSLAHQQAAKVDRRKQQEQKKRKILEEDAKATKQAERKKAQQARKMEELRRSKGSQQRKQRLQAQKRAEQIAIEEQKKKQIEKIEEKKLRQTRQRARKQAEKSKQILNNSSRNSANRYSKKQKQANQDQDVLGDSKSSVKPHKQSDWNSHVQIKRTNSFVQGQLTSGFLSDNSKLKKKQHTDTKSIIYYTLFMIISFFVILQVMTPSSKV